MLDASTFAQVLENRKIAGRRLPGRRSVLRNGLRTREWEATISTTARVEALGRECPEQAIHLTRPGCAVPRSRRGG